MGLTLTEKILKAHLVEGEMVKGSEIGIRIDQTLTQDATGTMAYLEFEAMGVPRVRTERSVAYIDHNTLQNGFENADDHRFIGSVAKKHGIYFSRPGNGICHQVHLERFGVPGKTLIEVSKILSGEADPHRRRHRHAGVWCRRSGRCSGNGRWYVLHHLPKGGKGRTDRKAVPLGCCEGCYSGSAAPYVCKGWRWQGH